MKLENVVYRTEFEELKERLMVVEDALAIEHKKKENIESWAPR